MRMAVRPASAYRSLELLASCDDGWAMHERQNDTNEVKILPIKNTIIKILKT